MHGDSGTSFELAELPKQYSLLSWWLACLSWEQAHFVLSSTSAFLLLISCQWDYPLLNQVQGLGVAQWDNQPSLPWLMESTASTRKLRACWRSKPTTKSMWTSPRAQPICTQVSSTSMAGGQGPLKERGINSFLAGSHQMISERARNSLQGKWNRLMLKQLNFKNAMQRKGNTQGQALSFTELIHYETLFYSTLMSMQSQEKKGIRRLCDSKK